MANEPVPAPVHHETQQQRDWWFIIKLVLCVLLPPLAVFLELHSFDRIPLIITGISLVLWIFGWLPGGFLEILSYSLSESVNDLFRLCYDSMELWFLARLGPTPRRVLRSTVWMTVGV